VALLAPLFLIGALAIGLPFWLHRLQTQSSIRQPFSSAMLLETTEQQVHLQKKLKYFVLLALRVALLALLVLAFTKPVFYRPASMLADDVSGTHLILVDTSVSMSRAGVFSQAIAAARRAIDDVPNTALLQVLSADSSLRLASDLSGEKAIHRAALPGLSVSALRLDFGEMMRAVGRLADSMPAPVTLHVVSDFQASGMPVRFSDLVLSQIAEIVPYVVGTGTPFNWSVEYVRETAGGLDIGLTGYGDRERVAEVELVINDVVLESRGLSVTGPQTVQFANPEYIEGDNEVAVRIITDDDLQADNLRFHVVERKPPTEVPLITYASDDLPVTYLSAALESAAGSGFNVQTLVAGQFDTRILSRYTWAVIDDIGSVDAELDSALTGFLQGGGNLLAFAGQRAVGLEVLPVSGHRHSPASIDSSGSQFLSIGQIDTGHPLLSQTEGWHNVNFTRSMPVETLDGDQVLIRLENNEPFLIERRIGEGRLLLVLGGLNNRWNDFPVHPVFVSFIIETARYLSGTNNIAKTHLAGATLPLALVGSVSGQVVDPDGNRILSLADTTREQRIKLNKPGFYTVYTEQEELSVAVNIDPLESDLQTISQEVLDRWQDATAGQSPTANVAGSRAPDLEPVSVELWHWLLLLLALVIIGESLLGNTYLSPRRQERA
jgi:hypothetical protein